MINFIEVNSYIEHDMLEVLKHDLNLALGIRFLVFFVICFFIAKKISKKTIMINNIIYIILLLVYFIVSFIKAFYMSSLPPHIIEKMDSCGFGYSLVQLFISFYIPIVYTIVMLASLGDKKYQVEIDMLEKIKKQKKKG